VSADAGALVAPIVVDAIRIEPLSETHREALRAICPIDDPVWEIYPYRMAGEDFDRAFEAMLKNPTRQPFALLADRALVGTSGYIAIDAANRTLEIGGTYMTPATRGTGLNGQIKPLLIGRAFASGFERIMFRIDARNLRSQRAVAKLGAVQEGVLRRDRVTWTGHVRDTVLFSILKHEWR
jgi:RimJ/RimL family protein N-acetyltransferase